MRQQPQSDPGPSFVGFCLDGHFRGTWQSSYQAPMRMHYAIPDRLNPDYYSYDPTRAYAEDKACVATLQYFWKEITFGDTRRCFWTTKPPEPLNSAEAWIDIIDSLVNLSESLRKDK